MTITCGGKVGIGRSPSTYKLEVDDNIYCKGWIRTSGSTGWYNETYAGGWYMQDTIWIRNQNSKPLHLEADNNYGGGGHRLMIDCYAAAHSSIGLRNNACGWYICSNNNKNLYFSYRPNTSATSYTEDYYVAYISPTAGIISNYGVTALSDARHKQVIGSTTLTVEDIAEMPTVAFKWTDGRTDDSVHVGTLAQNWQSVLPEVVNVENNEEGTLSFNYGVAALVSSITTARKVVDHEKEIKALKAKINVLEERISELEK